jgi:hypothetical protein
MSLNTKNGIWLTLAAEKYPKLNERELNVLSFTAASHWYTGTESELSHLYDQYVMLKRLAGIGKLEDDNKDTLWPLRKL